MKIKHIIVTLLTLCLLLSIAACDKVDEPPANDTTAEIITEAHRPRCLPRHGTGRGHGHRHLQR